MNYFDNKLNREQIDKKLVPLKEFTKHGLSSIGWIKTIREALGMTSSDLASRVGVNQSRIIHMEKSEIEGNIKISTMKKIADALDMDFVYGFVPRTSLNEMVREQARKIASQKMQRLDHTMRLELQELSSEEKEKALEDMTNKILIGEPKDFWKK
ncbi:MAG: mobile mystery protein A [Clostridiaceae bacterium]|nr:mobile mystery protein A [Clostridiaceae bacterium]